MCLLIVLVLGTPLLIGGLFGYHALCSRIELADWVRDVGGILVLFCAYAIPAVVANRRLAKRYPDSQPEPIPDPAHPKGY